jgi:hypothetical protein
MEKSMLKDLVVSCGCKNKIARVWIIFKKIMIRRHANYYCRIQTHELACIMAYVKACFLYDECLHHDLC